jgi:AcrR family transcriptional regulator
MPYPSQVTSERIVAAAAQMIEAEGVEALSLARLATTLGIKAPSLYRYYNSKTRLLEAVNLQTTERLVTEINSVDVQSPEEARLLAMAHAWRNFALARPHLYLLAFSDSAPPDSNALLAWALPLQAIMATLAGEREALAALRGLFALLHGFAALEINQQFQRGGDLQADFDYAVRRYLRGIAR